MVGLLLFALVLVVIGLHLLLACGFMLYFFHVPPSQQSLTAGSTGEEVKKVSDAVPEGKAEDQDAKTTKEKKSAEGSETKEKRAPVGEDDDENEEEVKTAALKVPEPKAKTEEKGAVAVEEENTIKEIEGQKRAKVEENKQMFSPEEKVEDPESKP